MLTPSGAPGIDAALETAAQTKRWIALFVVGGDWCKWCVALKEGFKTDDRLLRAIEADSLILAWQTVDRKNVDTSGLRERFNIPSIPFFALLNERGEIQAATEFIGDLKPDFDGYLSWLKSNNDSAL